MDGDSPARCQDWTLEEIERLFELTYIGADRASLRLEDRKKTRELDGFLRETARALDAVSRRRDPIRIVDAAAGKAYVGLLTLKLVVAPRARRAALTIIERDRARVDACRAAAEQLLGDAEISYAATDVTEASSWPAEPDLVVALHACGDATDRVIERAIERRARHVLVAPCCVAADLPAARRAEARADRDGLPRHAEVRRMHLEAMVLAERVLTLEAAGWETTVVSFVAPTVTPYHRLLRGRRVGEPQRMGEARERLRRMRA